METMKASRDADLWLSDYESDQMREDVKLLDIQADHEYEEIIRQLANFDRPASELPYFFLINLTFKTLCEVSMMTLAMASNLVVKSSGFLFFNVVGDPILQASYGLYCFFTLAIHDGLVISNLEKLGIRLSTSYGSGEYRGCKAVFSKGILTAFLLVGLVTLPVTLMTEKLMLLIGLDPVYAKLNQEAMYWSLPMFVLFWIAELIKTFCIAQGRERVVQISGLVSAVMCFFSITYS